MFLCVVDFNVFIVTICWGKRGVVLFIKNIGGIKTGCMLRRLRLIDVKMLLLISVNFNERRVNASTSCSHSRYNAVASTNVPLYEPPQRHFTPDVFGGKLYKALLKTDNR